MFRCIRENTRCLAVGAVLFWTKLDEKYPYKYPGGRRCTNGSAILAVVFSQGERFHEFKKDNFYQIQWRPRPASLLTSAEKKKVVKNLRKVSFVDPCCLMYE